MSSQSSRLRYLTESDSEDTVDTSSDVTEKSQHKQEPVENPTHHLHSDMYRFFDSGFMDNVYSKQPQKQNKSETTSVQSEVIESSDTMCVQENERSYSRIFMFVSLSVHACVLVGSVYITMVPQILQTTIQNLTTWD